MPLGSVSDLWGCLIQWQDKKVLAPRANDKNDLHRRSPLPHPTRFSHTSDVTRPLTMFLIIAPQEPKSRAVISSSGSSNEK